MGFSLRSQKDTKNCAWQGVAECDGGAGSAWRLGGMQHKRLFLPWYLPTPLRLLIAEHMAGDFEMAGASSTLSMAACCWAAHSGAG